MVPAWTFHLRWQEHVTHGRGKLIWIRMHMCFPLWPIEGVTMIMLDSIITYGALDEETLTEEGGPREKGEGRRRAEREEV